jgi:GPI-anchor transamidase subunit T
MQVCRVYCGVRRHFLLFFFPAHSLIDDLITIKEYVPSVDEKPTLLQAELTLPPQATVLVRMEVTKAFLKYTAHMPDAQRGWDLPGAILVPLDDGLTNAMRGAPFYTRTVLVDLATPDFSMPYNVIIMTCTLIALVFGSIVNLLVRRFVVIDMNHALF